MPSNNCISSQSDNRITKFDNIKFFLIVSVVVGHAINSFTKMKNPFDAYQSLFGFIYSFHMPAFLFLSGLFQPKLKKDTPFNWSKIGLYLRLIIIINILNFLPYIILNRDDNFEILSSSGMSWFLYALSIYYIVIYLMRNVKPVYLLIFATVASLFAGYDVSITSGVLFQAIGFFPYFLLGYVMKKEQVEAITSKIPCKIFAAIFLIVLAVLCFLNPDFILEYRGLLTFTQPYPYFSAGNIQFYHRLLIFLLQSVSAFSVMCLIPSRKLPFITNAGSRTLNAYVLHRFILLYVQTTSWKWLLEQLGYYPFLFVWVLFAIVLACILCTDVVDKFCKWIFGTHKSLST